MKYFVIDLNAGRIILSVFLFTIVILSFTSCDPRGTDDMYRGGAFQIKVKVLNAQDSLKLGDSLKVIFEIPDTVQLKGFPFDTNSIGEQIIFTDKVYCEPGEGLGIADSTKSGGIANPLAYNWCAVYANPGNLVNTNQVLHLVKVGNKLIANYYMIPSRKGVFYLVSDGLGGYFEGNSTSGKIKCRIVFDFDVVDRHHNLLRTAVGQNNDVDPMIQQMSGRGQGLYVFAVK